MLIDKNLLSTERIYNFGGERLLSVGIVYEKKGSYIWNKTISMPPNY